MTAIPWKKRLSAILPVLLCAGMVTSYANADAVKRKKPPQVQQDPMETENSPPPPATPPVVDSPPPDKPPERESSGSSGSSSRSSHSSSGGSGNSGREASEPAPGKAGPFMFNVKIGPSLCAFPSGCPHQGAFVLDLGAALTRNRNGYLLLPLQIQFQPGVVAVMIPIGFQYDIKVPVRGLYVYPRISAGYAALISDGSQPGIANGLMHSGFVIPEFGIKYILRGRWNFGGELVSLPVFLNSNGAQIYYRLALSAGVNF